MPPVADSLCSRRHRTNWRIPALYFWALVREFRWTLAALVCAVMFATFCYWITPHDALGGRRPTFLMSWYGGWMALLAQPLFNPPQTWYLTLLCGFYPILGAVIIGEGVVRLALLMMSRRRGEKEWARVMASTYRDHVVLCGLGHLGFRVLEQLVRADVDVIALEKRRSGKFVTKAKEMGVPVLIRDMQEDQALIDAGIAYARAVVICTNNAMSNLEVALDARRMNHDIRVVMRLFDEPIAEKVAGAMNVDLAFSSSSLAAPVVAALAVQNNAPGTKILSSTCIAGVTHVAIEFIIRAGSPLAGKSVKEIESEQGVRVLAHGNEASVRNDAVISGGDKVVVHAPISKIATITGNSSSSLHVHEAAALVSSPGTPGEA